jgi:S1-C subfamily serine protease
VPPHRRASRRTAIIAALLLFAATGGASAGVVALTTHSSPPATTAQTTPSSSSSGTGTLPANPGRPNSNPIDVNAVAAKVDPAVVNITVTISGGQGTAQGTGMVISSNGQILTNNHVIDGASSISVQIGGTGSTYSAKVVGYDVADDVALLQIQGNVSGLKTISVGDPTLLSIGDSVLALGNALGRGGAPQPAAGVVTGVGQTITASDSSGNTETLTNLIETNARILPGDSGGPLVDGNGNVVGMNTAASVSGGRFRRITGGGNGYAIPISTAMSIVQQIRAGGGGSASVQVGDRALLGVRISSTATATGASVVGVESGSPAASAGIVAGDVITSVGGSQVTSPATLQTAILAHKPGDTVKVTWVDAAGQQHSATVKLTTGPPA